MRKIQAVEKILTESREIRDWYREEHNLTIDNLTDENVRVYGRGGYGDITDLIITDGIKDGIISEDDI